MSTPVVQQFFAENEGLTPTPPAPCTTPEDVIERSGLPWLALDLPFEMPYAAMLEEAKALKPFFVNHRSTDLHKGWRSLCVHGLSPVHTLNHQHYGFPTIESAPYGWTDMAKFAPVTTAFFRDTFGYERYGRVRFMLLEPGGYIAPHDDDDVIRLHPINIALSNPPGCRFVMKGQGTVPFAPGRAIMLAVGNQHSIWNDSDEDRFHIIVHGIRGFGGHWSETIMRSYAAVSP